MNNGHDAYISSMIAAADAARAQEEEYFLWRDAVEVSNELAAQTVTVSDTLSPRLLGRMSSAERKEYPITRGVLDYFPDALALVSHLSWAGNQKHNPGQPMHWARSKSGDHSDCLGRHLLERDGSDFLELDDGQRVEIPHRVAIAWRALAELQLWAEQEFGLGMAPGARE
ncbi:MAG: hypothetical protein A3E01_07065 [Gammaproteobacteria bacterium RIFCSPHIGHO2_12_FULL_63_22]|nr:MAG: hypothetical protein A3E01_07065 [Gammaproteobacteria bacterium RIFCSPHIGHO2_12_FULL_63_22]